MRRPKGIPTETWDIVKKDKDVLRGFVFNFNQADGGKVDGSAPVNKVDCPMLLQMFQWIWAAHCRKDLRDPEAGPYWMEHAVEFHFECQHEGCECGGETHICDINSILDDGRPWCSAENEMLLRDMELTWEGKHDTDETSEGGD